MELFDFLATRVAEIDTDKHVISTYHKDVLCTQARTVDGFTPCSHEEADTRILRHVQNAVRQGYSKVLIRTVDTDVIVLAVTAAGRLDVEELWVAYGTGKKSGSWQLTGWLWHWDLTSVKGAILPCPLLDVTPFQAMGVGERKKHRKPGKPVMR